MSLAELSQFFSHRFHPHAVDSHLTKPIQADIVPADRIPEPGQELLRIKRAAAKADLRTHTVMSLIEFEQDLIEEFLAGTIHALKNILETLAKPISTSEDLKQRIESIFCIVHQVKGDSAILNLTRISKQAHLFEHRLVQLTDIPNLSTKDLKQLVAPLKAMISAVRDVKTVFDKIMSGGWNQKKVITNNSMSIKLEHLINKLSRDCGKRVMVINDGYTDAAIPEDLQRVISSLITQLARNSVVHGIESEEARVKLNKTPYGCFHVMAKRREKTLDIITRDDGKGIDSEKIRQAALKSNRFSHQQMANWTKASVLQAIFMPGFSTLAAVTEHAGRGVGMDLIKSTVEKYRGTIKVKSVPGQFTEFTMSFPVRG